jgi:hypothetical protein
LKHRADHLLHLPRPPSRRASPPATDVLPRHHSDLHLSSPPLCELRAGALHLFSGLPSPVPHHRPTSLPRDRHGEPLRCLCPKSGPSPPGLAPWHLLPRPLATGRPDSAGEPRVSGELGGGGAPLFHLGPKGVVGWAGKAVAKWAWPIPTVPFHIFHSELIQNSFQFSLNF